MAERVRAGGHHVADDVVRRRYAAGRANFFRLYRPLAEAWQVYDSSIPAHIRRVAEGQRARTSAVYDEASWHLVARGFEDAEGGQA